MMGLDGAIITAVLQVDYIIARAVSIGRAALIILAIIGACVGAYRLAKGGMISG